MVWLNRAKTLDFNSMAEAMADELQHRGQDPIDIGNRRLHSDRSE
jgi:hypothetical protein